MTFGHEIKRIRIASGMTQVQLAEKIGITQGSVANLESGRLAALTAEKLYALSDALGVSCDHWRPFLAEDNAGAAPLEPEPPAIKPKKKK